MRATGECHGGDFACARGYTKTTQIDLSILSRCVLPYGPRVSNFQVLVESKGYPRTLEHVSVFFVEPVVSLSVMMNRSLNRIYIFEQVLAEA